MELLLQFLNNGPKKEFQCDVFKYSIILKSIFKSPKLIRILEEEKNLNDFT